MPTFIYDTQVKLRVTITQNDVPIDPTEVYIIIDPPNSTTITDTYNGGAGGIVKESSGVYYYLVDVPDPGAWEYRWKTTVPKSADEGYFVVNASRVATP